MTMVLRDSLGGNCKTKMIATMSAEKDDILESLSTCRFAQRVSRIQNVVTRNEQVDPGLIIQRLKKEVSELKAELALVKGEESKEHLTSEDVDRCNKMVEDFIATTDPSKTIVLADRLMINQCFYHFRHLFKDMEKKAKAGGGGSSAPVSAAPTGDMKTMQDEISRLQILIQQRDNEIGILLNYLNKKKGGEGGEAGIPVQRGSEISSTIASSEPTRKNEESKGSGSTLY